MGDVIAFFILQWTLFVEKENISDAEDVREKIEIAVCHRLIGLVTTFHELIQSAFPEGASADSITKVCWLEFSSFLIL